jgi:hypothetical protein
MFRPFHSPVTFILLGPNILKILRPSFTFIKSHRQNYGFVILMFMFLLIVENYLQLNKNETEPRYQTLVYAA